MRKFKLRVEDFKLENFFILLRTTCLKNIEFEKLNANKGYKSNICDKRAFLKAT